ncbi:MAG: WD40 repeat-containing protein, partial [Planctomycetota bacterium]
MRNRSWSVAFESSAFWDAGHFDREVALKVPRFAPDDREMTERFHREARAAARLHHPNIVTLHENGQTDQGPYLVVEFIDGVPLSQLLREQPVELRVAVDWVRQIAEGLHYAHSEGIVHRDVKPANIMMNHAGRPLIMDFGLAKRDADVESGMTMEGQIVGTPNYMSPEQARGAISEIGPHSDQYSVGVVLYEMLCGRQPFSGDPWTVIARVANVRETPPPPRSVKPDLPRDLEACCLKAMEKEPGNRYASLQALADDLDHWLKGLPLLARPIGPLEQFARWCRHNRMIASLGGAIAALLLIAAIVGPWLAVRFQELAADSKRDADAAEAARKLENTARLATERSVIDSYTETGLTAHRNGDPREAILWFANAVAASENYPPRERHNRIRMQSWLSQIATPVQAFAVPPAWKKTLSYHPSGRWLLSLSNVYECELLQVSDGKRLAIPLEGQITAATFSPDGTRLVVAAKRDVAVFEFVDRTTGFDTMELDRWTHSDSVNCLQFSADGELLVVGGNESAQVRDVEKRSFRTDLLEVGSQVTSAAISADGRRFAVRCDDQWVCLFSCVPDEKSYEPLLPALPSKSGGGVVPMFLGNDRLVVTSDYQSVRCWNIDSKKIVWEHKPRRVLTSAISPDEKWIALGEDGDVVLLNSTTGEPAEEPIKHPNLINNVSFHPNKPLLLTASVDHSARIFEIPSGKPVGLPIPHSDAVHRCVWSPDGATFATVHWSGDLIRIWKPSDPQLEEFVAAESARGPFVRLNDRGDRWLPSGFDGGRDRTEVEVFDVQTGQVLGPKLSGPGLISDADFVPKSPLIVLAGGGKYEDLYRGLPDQKLETPGFVRFVNSETGEPVFTDVTTASQPIAVRTSPDGRSIVVLCHQGHLLVFDSATGKLRAEHQAFDGQPAVHGYLIRDRIRFSERGDQFLIWGCNALAELRRADTGERVARFSHDSSFIHDVQFSPDGQLVATCSSDHSVRLWDTATGLSTGAPLAHSGWVFSAQFSRDGRRLLTASEDKQARIWDLKSRTAILATREHGDQVFGVTFLPGEEMFLASTRDGQITAWDASLGKMIAPARRMPGMVYQLSRR